MRRILFLVLVVAAAAGFATPSYAFLTPGKTDGTELALLPAGPDAWNMTVESSGSITTGTPAAAAMNWGVQNGVGFAPNLAVCNGSSLICGTAGPDAGSSGGTEGVLYFSLSFFAGAPQIGLNVGSPALLGVVQTAPGSTPSFFLDDIEDVFGPLNPPPPVDFVEPPPAPEPAAFVFVAMGLGSLALVRRRSA
jgi:hypothetical protein